MGTLYNEPKSTLDPGLMWVWPEPPFYEHSRLLCVERNAGLASYADDRSKEGRITYAHLYVVTKGDALIRA